MWRRWIVYSLVLLPGGVLLGVAFGDPANGEFDTAFAYGSWSQVLFAAFLGVWVTAIPWTAIYFERVNAKIRAAGGDEATASQGFALAIAALVTAWAGLAPIALVLAWWALRRTRATGVRYARGTATAVTAAVVAAVSFVPIWLINDWIPSV